MQKKGLYGFFKIWIYYVGLELTFLFKVVILFLLEETAPS